MKIAPLLFQASELVADGFVDSILFFLIVVSGSIFYFVPFIISLLGRHQNPTVVFVLNLLLGWTLVGWVVAFIWSFKSVIKRPSPKFYICRHCKTLNSVLQVSCNLCAKEQ